MPVLPRQECRRRQRLRPVQYHAPSREYQVRPRQDPGRKDLVVRRDGGSAMTGVDRRAFLRTTVGAALGCGAHVLAALAGASTSTRHLFAAEPRGVPVRREPWGRLERAADGVWM